MIVLLIIKNEEKHVYKNFFCEILQTQDLGHAIEFYEYIRQRHDDKKSNILEYEFGCKPDDEWCLYFSMVENKNDP